MSFPSINLNIFKRLEYFLFLVRNNRRFNAQLKIKISIEKKSFPTWEIEKKIFYWSYWGHKHLGREITIDHFNSDNMKVSGKETDAKSGIKFDKIMENLVVEGFFIKEKPEDKGYVITKEGLEFSEFIWDVYNMDCKYPTFLHKGYYKIYDTPYKLKGSFDFLFNMLQVTSIFILAPVLVFATILVSIKYDKAIVFLKKIDLFDKIITKVNFETLAGCFQVFVIIIGSVFVLAFFLDIIYRYLWPKEKNKAKYLKAERDG